MKRVFIFIEETKEEKKYLKRNINSRSNTF